MEVGIGSARAASVAIALAAFAGLSTAGCDRLPLDEPPELHYGEDPCAQCRMIVSEERFATAVVAERDGRLEVFPFDDVSCQLRWEESTSAEVRARWVHDHGTGAWLPAADAFYVRSTSIRSPMGSGVLARSSRSGAEEEAGRRNGDVLTWTELRAGRSGLTAPPPKGGAS
jgi:copper chaperone NosL